MIRDIDVGLLRAFLAVVETGSVTSASRLLNRTQAAVSQQIKRLEELLQTELFHREHKRVSVNAAGERLIEKARTIVGLNDETWGLMTTPQYNGKVHLGIPSDIVSTYAPPILRRFAQAWPHVQVSLACSDSETLITQLEGGEIDLTLTTETDCPPHAECLTVDKLVWVTGEDSDAETRSPLPVAFGSTKCRFRPVLMDALRQAGRDWRFVMEVSNEDATNAAVAAGLGVKAILHNNIPVGLRIVDEAIGLPRLPDFGINLYLPRAGGTQLANELANHIRADFAARFGHPPPGPPRQFQRVLQGTA
ncbi:MAG: LysR family transcriptional regulator [Hyphomicrobiaceae bacterium]|nr:LysR family transcriptional regulator [Hyphomicrobiaceae bacterium]